MIFSSPLLGLFSTPRVAVTTPLVINGSFSNMLLDPTRPLLYLFNDTGNSITVFNTTSDKVTANIPVGSRPSGMDISADGKQLYVALAGASAVAVVNTTSLMLTAKIPISISPGDVCAGKQGRAYVTESGVNEDWNYPVVVDTNASREIGGITSAGQIFSGAICLTSPDRQTLYIGDRDQEPSTIFVHVYLSEVPST